MGRAPVVAPEDRLPNTAGWLKTIFDGHAQVAKGLKLQLPIFVMTSDRTHIGTTYSPICSTAIRCSMSSKLA